MFPTAFSPRRAAMKIPFLALLGVLFGFVAFYDVALAQDYTVPVTINSKAYTLTVTVQGDGVTVKANSPDVRVGAVTKVEAAAPAVGSTDLATLKTNAISVPYDDLFRYNEQHVGQAVQYVGKVIQVQENICLLCDNPGYVLRIEVTKGDYGLWDDPVWVDYPGTKRFLEDDIVTFWGTVKGLKTYEALLGNSVTVPWVEAPEIQLGEVASTSATASGPRAKQSANLRSGPGTTFSLVGSVDADQALTIVARNTDGSWYQLEGGQWIAAFLVTEGPEASSVPQAKEIPLAPAAAGPTGGEATPAPAAANAAATSSAAVPGMIGIGQDIEGSGWRFKVSEVHKRKAVYFYSSSHIAMGHYLIVILDAVNEQSGTDTFDSNVDLRLVDSAGYKYDDDWSGSSYAEWQYGGLSSIYTNVNPGNFVRIVLAFDLPDNTGDVYLKSDLATTIQLGNFAQMATEDN